MKSRILCLAAILTMVTAGSVSAANLSVVSPGLSPDTSAACPSGCKLAVNLDGTSTPSFLISSEPEGETVFRVGFWVDPRMDGMVNGERPFRIIEIRKDAPGGRILAFASIYRRADTLRINFIAYNDDNSTRPVGGFVMGNAGPSRFELEWVAASGPGTNDGLVRVKKGNEVKEITDYNYYNGGSGVDHVRFGYVAAGYNLVDTFFLDKFESYRTLAP